jgi:hypothetical protein
LKNERVHGTCYRTREEAIADLFDYIEIFYNRSRRHSTLGYQSDQASGKSESTMEKAKEKAQEALDRNTFSIPPGYVGELVIAECCRSRIPAAPTPSGWRVPTPLSRCSQDRRLPPVDSD